MLDIEEVKKIIEDRGLDPEDVTPNSTLYDDVGLDSTEAIVLFRQIIKRHNVGIESTEFKTLTKLPITEMISYINDKS